METIYEVFQRYLPVYLKSSKQNKQAILDTVCEMTSFHRKAAIRKFRVMQFCFIGQSDRRGRPTIYGPDVIAALREVWEASSEICGELLHPVISDYVNIMKRDGQWPHRSDATLKLLQMSEGTVKAKVGQFMKARHRRKGISSTRPSALKNIIPIVTGQWNDKPPGYGQIDTVVHCGSSLLGDMVFSVNYTDIATLWLGLFAQWNKGQQATLKSIKSIRERLPFKLLGLHPDTGSEFINWHLKNWCDEQSIEMTRSRPSHKNDNAYVEQKNGHVIRRFLGYTRFDVPETVTVINTLYVKLELYLNHFVPSRICIEKLRVGARYQRRYDKAQTPYTRVLAHPDVSDEIKKNLQQIHATLNPLNLKQEIDKLSSELLKFQRQNGNQPPSGRF
ncbi:MAG: integrase [Bacteroidota bacterium]|nr:integrase [Bacteroidota bacterium]